MLLKPTEDRIVCAPEEVSLRTSGGLYVPENAKGRPQTAIVVAVGPGAILPTGQRKPMELQVGDRIMLAKNTGTKVKDGEEWFIILHEHDVPARFER
jgi:chaperonin GroES